MRRRSTLTAAGVLALSLLAASAVAETVVPVDQGWSAADKKTWYTLTQGSRLIPEAWLKALEQPGPAASPPKLFLDRAHIEQYRYLPSDVPGELPIGFARDVQNDSGFSTTRLRWKNPQSNSEPWVGFTCSACHTAELTFNDKRMRIDGGPTLADFQGFMAALNIALSETRSDPDKSMRFARAVLGPAQANSAQRRDILDGELKKLLDWQLKVETANKTPLAYGYSRLDAFGNIFNKVLLRVEADPQLRNPSDAPVSYPFLWNIHQHNKVQWNGIAPNGPRVGALDVGALGRNVGEVIGVFADVKFLPPGPAVFGYPSSANIPNLSRLEQQIARLKPPVWPDALPPIDAAKWEAGKTLFEKNCASCHQVLERGDLKTNFEVEMTPLAGAKRIGTDPWMACNAYTYQARSGDLRNTPKRFFLPSISLNAETEELATLLGTGVIGSIWRKADDVLKASQLKPKDVENLIKNMKPFEFKKGTEVFDTIISQWFPEVQDTAKKARLKRCFDEASELLAYKGRPLNGIWATPPFLHNGSVPTLYDLLLAPEKRPAKFSLGTREFDPEKVGYVTDGSRFETAQTKAANTFVFDTTIDGNLNAGHDYGNAAMTDPDRMALIEYMKAVGGKRSGDKIVP